MRVEFHILHTMAVVLKKVDSLAGFLTRLTVLRQCLDDRVDIFRVEFVVTEFGPRFCLRVGRSMNRLGNCAKTFFDVVPVGDLEGAGKQLRSGVPNPGSTVTQNGASLSSIKTPARGFSQDPFGELRTFGTSVRGGCAFDAAE